MSHTFAGAFPERIQCPTRLCNSNDRNIEHTPADHSLQSRKNLLVGQISASAKKYEGVRLEALCVIFDRSKR